MLLLEVVNDRVDGGWGDGARAGGRCRPGREGAAGSDGGVLGEAAMRLTGPDGWSGGANAGSGAPAIAIGE